MTRRVGNFEVVFYRSRKSWAPPRMGRDPAVTADGGRPPPCVITAVVKLASSSSFIAFKKVMAVAFHVEVARKDHRAGRKGFKQLALRCSPPQFRRRRRFAPHRVRAFRWIKTLFIRVYIFATYYHAREARA